jgi:Fe-S-cluster-containing hydrogenase component 2
MNRFVIADFKKCIGCSTCMAGCVDVHGKAGLAAVPRLHVTYLPSATMPLQCRNCDNAPCEKVCPVKAITFQDRSVQLNESVCISCKMCALACPFGSITFFGTKPRGEESPTYGTYPQVAPPLEPRHESLHPLLDWVVGQRAVAVKCDLCHWRPQGPECVRVCPTKTLVIVDPDNVSDLTAWRRIATAFDHPVGD